MEAIFSLGLLRRLISLLQVALPLISWKKNICSAEDEFSCRVWAATESFSPAVLILSSALALNSSSFPAGNHSMFQV